MKESVNDCWRTPQWLFDELNQEFNFDIDLCATKENSKCNIYCTDYLRNEYNELKDPFRSSGTLIFSDERDPSKFSDLAYFKESATCFMNPPYSNPKPFIEKAWEDSKHCKIVCLVKCDPSTRWWATFWNYGPNKCCFLCKNIKNYELTYGCSKCGATWPAGPKPGCEVRFFPKRIKFDPPQELIDRGEIVKENGNCYKRLPGEENEEQQIYSKLSGPTFPCALLIFDRRGL